MSLESALEEERLEILKLLEGPARRQSGAQSTPSSPRMGYASLARTTSPQRHVSSLIDAVAGVSPRNRTPVHSGSSSPVDSYSPSNDMFRSRSEIGGNPRILGSRGSGPGSYDFPMMPSLGGSGTKKRTASQPSMLDSGMFPQRSKSPLANPAFNHHGRAISPNSEDSSGYRSPPRSEHMLMSGGGVMIDLDHAYARLNDDALSRSGGALAKLPERRPILDKHGDAVRAGMGESLTKDGGLRLQKDVNSDDEAVMDSSDEDSSDQEDSDPASSDEEGRGRPSIRNRVASLVKSPSEPGGRTVNSDRETGIVQGGKKKGKKNRKKGKRKTMSLLAAAEEERQQVSSSSKYHVRSLLPSISVTPSGAGSASTSMFRRSGVHPSTNFDVSSLTSTPVSSDQEADDLDIRRAQRMETSLSPIVSNPETHRVIRTILRGDYDALQREALEKNKRTRKYLVATDLSSEAQYAMEWTIGTVLRDGDTLLAICAVDQDTIEDGSKTVTESSIGEAMLEVSNQAQAAAASSLTCTVGPGGSGISGSNTPLSRDSTAELSRERTKAERERYVSAEAITGLITRLLKKTRLQVKVVIEVIHCKSPKHLLTEIIDLVEPTLVVLGSRGRSALKGVLLGSFSNYLVAKSSVPVMVARKKLKQTKKYSQTNIRLTNNLTSNTARILANAKVD